MVRSGYIVVFNNGHPPILGLVGGFNNLAKYKSQWEGLSHILWNRVDEYSRIYSGWYTYPSEKYESPVGITLPNIWKNKKCSKPPTR